MVNCSQYYAGTSCDCVCIGCLIQSDIGRCSILINNSLEAGLGIFLFKFDFLNFF